MSATRRIFPETFKRGAVDRVTISGLSVEKGGHRVGVARNGVTALGEAVLGAGEGAGEAPHKRKRRSPRRLTWSPKLPACDARTSGCGWSVPS